MNEDSIMVLRVDFNNPDGFVTTIDIQEFEGKILEINGDRQMLYSLVQVEDEINLKCFIYKNDKLTFLSQINSVQESHPDFVIAFRSTSRMSRSVIICSGEKFIRIYEGLDGATPSLQEYYGFLPTSGDYAVKL